MQDCPLLKPSYYSSPKKLGRQGPSDSVLLSHLGRVKELRREQGNVLMPAFIETTARGCFMKSILKKSTKPLSKGPSSPCARETRRRRQKDSLSCRIQRQSLALRQSDSRPATSPRLFHCLLPPSFYRPALQCPPTHEQSLKSKNSSCQWEPTQENSLLSPRLKGCWVNRMASSKDKTRRGKSILNLSAEDVPLKCRRKDLLCKPTHRLSSSQRHSQPSVLALPQLNDSSLHTGTMSAQTSSVMLSLSQACETEIKPPKVTVTKKRSVSIDSQSLDVTLGTVEGWLKCRYMGLEL
jgi:hypothetical protein